MTGTERFFVIDRRDNTGRNADNRQRFLRRHKAALRAAVKRALVSGNMDELSSKGTKNLVLKELGTQEPFFHYGNETGVYSRVAFGNRDFVVGDTIPKDTGDNASGASGDGIGEDDFQFSIDLSDKEFQDMLFEDLELPNMVKEALTSSTEMTRVREGFAKTGPAANLDPKRTFLKSKIRRRVFTASAERLIAETQRELAEVLGAISTADTPELQKTKSELEEKLKRLQVRKNAIPRFAKNDARYRHWVQEPLPVHKAVMFHLMDVSGSMGEWEKEMAKRLYLTLRWFLLRQYDRVEPIYITYHTDAMQVNESHFFYGRETGGTVASNGLGLVRTILDEAFPITEWNVYVCHCSDGDNWIMDNPSVESHLQSLMQITQYYAYVEIMGAWRRGRVSSLWDMMNGVAEQHEGKFGVGQITGPRDIFPVFRSLFQKRIVS